MWPRRGVFLLLLVLQAGCIAQRAAPPSASTTSRLSRSLGPDTILGAGTWSVRLLVEPDDGVTPLIKAIDSARRTVFIAAYILSHRRIVRALERAQAHGVQVYVQLEPRPYGVIDQPQQMLLLLRSSGIAVKWRPPEFQYGHSKFLVIDDRLLVLSSANFSEAGFGSDRDFVIMDTAPADVRESSNVFRADWDRIGPTLTDPNLLVSPDNSRAKLLTLCARAHHTLDIYAEEVMDSALVNRLSGLARRGVRVRVIAATVGEGIKRRLRSVHIALKQITAGARHRYVHAKVLIVDDRLAFVGSENLSATSLDSNRELGVLIANPRAVAALSKTFRTDWSGAS